MKHVAYEDGSHRCYLTTTGRDRRYLGCRHETPRAAIKHTHPEYVPASRTTVVPNIERELDARRSSEVPVRVEGNPPGPGAPGTSPSQLLGEPLAIPASAGGVNPDVDGRFTEALAGHAALQSRNTERTIPPVRSVAGLTFDF